MICRALDHFLSIASTQAFHKKLGFSNIGSGPELRVGSDTLVSSIMTLNAEAQD